MLKENIKNMRKSKGLSQQQLADALCVVRQTVSKWEQGLSVPDSEMLLKLAECLGVSVGELLGECPSNDNSELQALKERLECLSEQIARRNESRRRAWRGVFLCGASLSLLALGVFVFNYVSALASVKDVAIIGGADGPTAIFVARSLHQGGGMGLFLAVAILCAIGLHKTKKK